MGEVEAEVGQPGRRGRFGESPASYFSQAEEAGFSVENMIQILNAGVTVETLLDVIERTLQASPATTGCSYRWVR